MKAAFISLLAITTIVTACDGTIEQDYPIDIEHERVERRGKLTGEGLTLFNGSDDEAEASASPIGVNSFLWRATLDTVSFLPLASADPFGGVIITDWHSEADTPTERYKLNILILDKTLRSDAVKVSVFKQAAIEGRWVDTAVNDSTARKIEDTILTRARELRVKQGR